MARIRCLPACVAAPKSEASKYRLPRRGRLSARRPCRSSSCHWVRRRRAHPAPDPAMLMQWLRRNRPLPPSRRQVPQAEWLEPRLLYSADATSLLGLAPVTTTAAEERTLAADFNYVATAQTLAPADV